LLHDRLTTDDLAGSRLYPPPGQAPLTAVVVAANEVLRRGLDGLLRSVPEVGTVHECADPGGFEAMLQQVRPDVVIVAAGCGGWLAGRYGAIADAGATVLVVVNQSSIEELGSYPSPPVGSRP
jgi:hypothetical protein